MSLLAAGACGNRALSELGSDNLWQGPEIGQKKVPKLKSRYERAVQIDGETLRRSSRVLDRQA